MDRLAAKADKLREMGHRVDSAGTRPALNTEGLYVNGEFLDEEFVNQLIAGDPLNEVIRARELWLNKQPR